MTNETMFTARDTMQDLMTSQLDYEFKYGQFSAVPRAREYVSNAIEEYLSQNLIYDNDVVSLWSDMSMPEYWDSELGVDYTEHTTIRQRIRDAVEHNARNNEWFSHHLLDMLDEWCNLHLPTDYDGEELTTDNKLEIIGNA